VNIMAASRRCSVCSVLPVLSFMGRDYPADLVALSTVLPNMN
jgi:hypothetical protein